MKKLLVITGPSGIGKTYLAQQLLTSFPKLFEHVSLFTTRKPRPSESFTDRVFVSEQEFLERNKRGDFIIAERFHDNWYGYTQSALTIRDKSIIVNAWPALIPKFRVFNNTMFIGLTTMNSNVHLLKQRMIERGDSAVQVTERTELIKKDLRDLEAVSSLIATSGKIFTIKNDLTLHQNVIPWITKQFDRALQP